MSESQLTLTVESVGYDGCHVVVVALGDKTIHRDGLLLDRADDRRRFIELVVTKLPAIVTGAEVSPESIEQELLAMAAKAGSTSRGRTSRKPVAPGTKVRALDRDNIGTVLCDQGDSCLVQFVSPDGCVAEKALSKSKLRLLGGESLNPAIKVTHWNEANPEPFPVDLLPAVMRNYINEGAAARCVDPAMVALPLLVTLAGCIGTTRRIMLKPDWIEPPTLWGAVVARSGSVKSPGFDLASDLLSDAESSAYRDHCDALAEYRKTRLDYERELCRWKKEKGNNDPPEEPPYPAAKRLQVEDTTIEALAPILTENVRGLLLMADELRGWFDGMGAYSAKGSGRDEARWLSLHHARPFSIDRKTNREYRRIELATVSVAGTIQPSVLTETMTEGTGVASGMLARLLIVMPPPRPKRWTEESLSLVTVTAMQTVVNRLRDELVHRVENEQPKPVDLAITGEARSRVSSFVNLHGLETYEQVDTLAAAWSKLEAYAFRFALVIHLTRWAAGDVDCDAGGLVGVDSIEAGIELARWFGAEAERAYFAMGFTSQGAEQSNRHADRLAVWLGQRGGSATERDIQRGPRRYRDGNHIKDDCEMLIKSERARWETGRRTRVIVLLAPGDSGDGDTLPENKSELAEMSPNGVGGVAMDSATLTVAAGDTSVKNTAETKQVSPSPVSLPVVGDKQAKQRVKVTL